jgi:LmbE family N-acetylglucosaminyl deacetylase
MVKHLTRREGIEVAPVFVRGGTRLIRRTCVFFHAHPDDEALLTSGTMARLATEGHRVVLVVATAGEEGLTEVNARVGSDLGAVRTAELRLSAKALGCARVELLGYADSGVDGQAVQRDKMRACFARVDPAEAAPALARILVEEEADLLTVYDPLGGYGHPDHVQVHRVGVLAAQMAGVRTVLQATIDRDSLVKALRLARWLRLLPSGILPEHFAHSYSARSSITHRVDVRAYIAAKRASMAAHVSQTSGGQAMRTLAALLRLPAPLFSLVLGTEWYVQERISGTESC